MIQIIAQINIWKNNLILGLTSNLSSKKLIAVIKKPKTQISHNLKLYSKNHDWVKKKLIRKKLTKNTTHILYGIGALSRLYFLGLSNIFNLKNTCLKANIVINQTNIDRISTSIKSNIEYYFFKYFGSSLMWYIKTLIVSKKYHSDIHNHSPLLLIYKSQVMRNEPSVIKKTQNKLIKNLNLSFVLTNHVVTNEKPNAWINEYRSNVNKYKNNHIRIIFIIPTVAALNNFISLLRL